MIYYAVECLASFIELYILFSLAEKLFEKKCTDIGTITLKISFVVLLTALTFVLNLLSLFSFVNISIFVLAIATALTLFYKTDFIANCSLAIVYIVILASLDFLALAVIELLGGYKNFTSQTISEFSLQRIIYITILKTVLIVLYLVFRATYKKSNVVWNKLGVISTGVMGIFCFVCMNFLIKAITLDEKTQIKNAIIIAWLFMILFIGVCLFLMNLFPSLQEKRKETEILSATISTLEENSIQLHHAYNQNAKNIHDFNNNLHTMQFLINNNNFKETKDYINQLLESTHQAEKQIYTGTEIVDAVLSNKAHETESQNISLTIEANYPSDCSIQSKDICALLVNLIDNAIESCSKTDDENKKFIDINISYINSMIFIKILNFAECSPFVSGELKTTKANAQSHGYGIKIIKSIVKKYDGTITQDYEDNTFKTQVTLNC